LQVKDNPNSYDENGNIIKIESLLYSPWTKIASIKTRRQNNYTNNLILKEVEPSGE
jgi:hypothetical protein